MSFWETTTEEPKASVSNFWGTPKASSSLPIDLGSGESPVSGEPALNMKAMPPIMTKPAEKISIAPTTPKANEFRVGAGMTPEQTKIAYQKLQPTTSDLNKDSEDANSFWGLVKNTIVGTVTPEPVKVRLPFQKEPTDFNAPPIITEPAKFGYALLEAIPKTIATIYGETIAPDKKTGQVNIGIDARRLGYDDPKYPTAAKEVTDKINAGENPWIAGLNIASSKTLDVAFGASLITDLAKMSAAMFLKGGPEAKIEAQNVVDAYKQNQNTVLERLKNSPDADWKTQLANKEKAMADLANTKNQAEKILAEHGAPTVADRAAVSASRYSELLGRETPITKNFWGDFSKPDLSLKTPTPKSPILDPKLLAGSRDVPGQATPFGLSTKEVENVGYSNGEIPKPQTHEEIASTYSKDVIEPKIKSGETIEVSGDVMKTYFGKDYAPERSSLYSKASYNILKNLLSHPDIKDFTFLGGGSGSGKSEFLGSSIKDAKSTQVLYDNSFSSVQGTKELFDLAKKNGKDIQVSGILSNLDVARNHTKIREVETGRPVTIEDFARGHAGFIEALKARLQDGSLSPDNLALYDFRNVFDTKVAEGIIKNGEFVENPLAILKDIKYNEQDIKNRYAKETITTGNKIKEGNLGTEGGSKGIEVPRENRTVQKEEVGKNSIQSIEKAVARAKAGEVFGPRDNFARRVQKVPKPKTPNRGVLEITHNTLGEIDKRIGGIKNGGMDFNGNTLLDLSQRQVTLEAMKDAIDNNPIQSLEKFEAKSGIFKGELPEVLGKSKEEILNSALYKSYKNSPDVLEFMRKGDYYIGEAGFSDSEEARVAYSRYKDMKEQYKDEIKSFTKEVKDYNDFTKQDVRSLSKMADQRIVTLDELEPPILRGETQSPKLDFTKWKDKNIFFLNRDTFERNLEKVATKPDADKLKEFIVDPVRDNELMRIKFNNELKTSIEKKVKELGIKRNSEADALVQIFGERRMSLDELKKASPKQYREIQKAADHFRNVYDNLLDLWNEERKKFGFTMIPKVPNYFRHFDEINFFVRNYGFLRSQDELPTEIAGKTEFFKPGKPFTTAELSRTGNSTKYSAIGGFNNYIESVSKQIFHIDSVQRGRALEKYMEDSSKLARRLGEPLQLSNMIANFREYVNNGLAGKTATLDRSIENTIGRPAIGAFHTISKLIGKNIIVGNLSTALSHLVSLPLIGSTTEKIPLIKGAMTTLTSPFKKGAFFKIDGQESSYLTRRYPMEEIMPTMPKKAETALSYIFTATDKFKARLAVSAKYYEGIRNGLSPTEAMKQADVYGGKVLGDYSLAQKPNLMNSKTMHLLAQFQLGLNDSMSVLLHDIPNEGSRWKVSSAFIQFAIYSYLFNLVLKNIRGAGKGIDPIDLGLTLTGMNDEGNGQSFPARLGLAAKDLSGELPFTSAFTGNFPLATAISQPIKDLGAGNYKKVAEDLLANFGSPIGGGLQVKKTIEGVIAIHQGGVYGPSGKMDFPQGESPIDKARSLIFGPYASETAKNFLNRNSLNAAKEAPMEKVYTQVLSLIKEGKQNEAQKIVDGLSDADYKIYKTVRANAVRTNTLQTEKSVYPTYLKIQELIKQGSKQEAQGMLDKMSDEEYKAYSLIYKRGGLDTSNTPSSSSQLSIGGRVSAYFGAITTSPVQAFHDIFTGQSIKGTKNGAVLVDRMSLQESTAIKEALLPPGGKSSDYQLDHIIPLELGGTNERSNLQLLTKAQDSANNAIENYLAKELGQKNITAKQAVQYMLDYKQGKKTTEDIKNLIKNI